MGQVGAGKSSLVQALLGEMEKISGSVTVKVIPNFLYSAVCVCLYVYYIPSLFYYSIL